MRAHVYFLNTLRAAVTYWPFIPRKLSECLALPNNISSHPPTLLMMLSIKLPKAEWQVETSNETQQPVKTWLGRQKHFWAQHRWNKGCEEVISCKGHHHQAKIKNLKIQPEGTTKYQCCSDTLIDGHLLISASCLRRFQRTHLSHLLLPTIICLCGRQGWQAFSLTSPFHCVTTQSTWPSTLCLGHLHWPLLEERLYVKLSCSLSRSLY